MGVSRGSIGSSWGFLVGVFSVGGAVTAGRPTFGVGLAWIAGSFGSLSAHPFQRRVRHFAHLNGGASLAFNHG
jgi:hypothetical protein